MNYITYLREGGRKDGHWKIIDDKKEEKEKMQIIQLVITINTKSRMRMRISNRPLVVDDLKDNNEDLSYTGFFISNIYFNSMIIYQLIIHT